jgi:hypothetical protein
MRENGIGVYIAYPTTDVMKFTYVNSRTRVNNLNTNVGFTKDSFIKRKSEYLNTFGGEIHFKPISEVSLNEFDQKRDAILKSIRAKYRLVGTTKQWFDSDDRHAIEQQIRAAIAAL